jgi:hypothetical protein
MGNMSYCRFENTARDLGDCVKALLNREAEELNHYELNGLALILEYANDIIDMEDYINDILEDNED